jgi:hypothetical protein
MELFDNIEAKLDAIGLKVGLPANQVRTIANSIQANLKAARGTLLRPLKRRPRNMMFPSRSSKNPQSRRWVAERIGRL